MKTSLLCFLLIFFLFGSVAAQTPAPKAIIKGTVVDSVKKERLGFVTVVIKDAKTDQPVKSALTKDDGSFSISVPTGKTYTLTVVFMGYKNKTVKVPAFTGAARIADMHNMLLSPTIGQLKEVSVTDRKPTLKQEVDRISYDVQADPESKALTALDMMRKVPLLAVDANNNITLRGSGNYKILINGKESALMANSPSDVLNAMPATNIERIEVITTPPAKYDAEGLDGIINIITKTKADEGYNVNLNGRFNSLYGPGINLSGTVKQGKIGFVTFLGTGSNGNPSSTSGNTQNFTADQSVLSQSTANTYFGHFAYGNGELSYEADSLHLLTASFDFYTGTNNNSFSQLSTQTTNTGYISQQYLLNNNGYNNYAGVDASLNYQLGFKKSKEQLLTLSYKFYYSPNQSFTNNSFTDTIRLGQPNYQQYNTSGSKVHTFQLDYAAPLSKMLNVEAGAKAILRNNFSNFETDDFNPTTNTYAIAAAQTNDFTYIQDIYSLYNSYQLKVNDYTAKAGLRVEHTTIDANFVSVGSVLSEGYNNLVPSVSLQRKLKNSSINFGFTERIQRPGIYQLNPFVNTSNPKFVTTGNPDLRPELNHSFELTYSNFQKVSVNVGLNYSFSNNSIQSVSNTSIQTTTSNIKDTVTTTTFQNLGSNSRLGFNINSNLTIIKNLTLTVNGNVQHVWLKGTYNSQFYQNEGFVAGSNGNLGYTFAKGYRLGLDASYFSGSITLQGKYSESFNNSFVLTREFLKKNATLSLVANNPESKYFTYRSYTSTPDYYQTTFNQNRYSTFAIRFSYKFGRLTSDIKKSKNEGNNDVN